MDIEGFVCVLMAKYQEHECNDIDGGDFHEILHHHGLIIERPATQADLDDGWDQWDVKVGDTIAVASPGVAEMQRRWNDQPQNAPGRPGKPADAI